MNLSRTNLGTIFFGTIDVLLPRPKHLSIVVLCLGIVFGSGCARNLMVPQKSVASFYPATMPAPQPKAMPLLIEITEAAPDYYEMIAASEFKDDFKAHHKRTGEGGRYWKLAAENPEARLALRQANLLLVRTDIEKYLREKFPQAVIVQDFCPPALFQTRYRRQEWLQHLGSTARTIPTKSGDVVWGGLEPAALPQADVIVSVDVIQGLNGEEGAMQGKSFGRYFTLDVQVWQNGSRWSQYGTKFENLSRQSNIVTVLSSFEAQPTPAELEPFKIRASKSPQFKDDQWLQKWMIDYDQREKVLNNGALALWRSTRAEKLASKWFTTQMDISGDLLKTYSTNVNSAPLLPYYKYLGEALDQIASSTTLPTVRTTNLKNWASYYEQDSAVLDQIDESVAFGKVTLSNRKLKRLSTLYKAETKFLTTLGEAFYQRAAESDYGTFARKTLIEQNAALTRYQVANVMGSLLGVAGGAAGMAQGGDAGYAFGQSMNKMGMGMMMAGAAADKSAGDRLAQVVTDAVGKMSVEIENQTFEIQPGSYQQLREQLKELYNK